MPVERLAEEVLFPKLSDEEIARIKPMGECRSFAAGTAVLEVGEANAMMIVVRRGALEVRNPRDGHKLVAIHTPGQFSGDIDLLTGRPIMVSIFSLGDGEGGPTDVLCVPQEKVRRLVNTIPRLGEKLMVAFQARRKALESEQVAGIRVVGPVGCGDTNRIREFLYKSFVPFNWIDPADPASKTVVEQFNGRKQPIVEYGVGKLLERPSLQEVARAAGIWNGCPTGEVDLAIVGGGPAGIAAAVYAASEGLKTVVLDALGPGGQAGGSSLIENFIGFPAGLSGADLATRGVLQMLKFGARMVAPVSIDRLEPALDQKSPHRLHTQCGTTVLARTVLAATGVRWRRLKAEGAERFERTGVYYACTRIEAQLYEGKEVAVVGGGNSAGQAAMFLSETCKRVRLLIRKAIKTHMSDYLVERIGAAGNIDVREGVEIARVRGDREIESIDLAPARLTPRDDAGPGAIERETLDCSAVFVFIGAEPHSKWLGDLVERDPSGYLLTGVEAKESGHWPLASRLPCPLETTLPRLLAAGDVRSGSTKRVGFAVGDGSLAVTCVHKLLSLGL